MTDHDVLYGDRLQLFGLAAQTSVSHACRVFGVHLELLSRRLGDQRREHHDAITKLELEILGRSFNPLLRGTRRLAR